MFSRVAIITVVVVVAVSSIARAEDGSIKGKVSVEGDAVPTFVWLEDAPPLAKAPDEHIKIVQEGSKFKPDVAVAVVHQTVDFPNNDKHYHNVFSVTAGNEFDLGLYRAGVSKSVEMKAPGEVVIYCNIHPDMVAHVLVVPSLYAAVAKDGTFEIKGVAVGKHKLTAWSGTHTPQSVDVEVKPGVAATATFPQLKKRASAAHLNKDGEQYGRYK